MRATKILFRGEQLLLDPGGVLVWPARELMAVADLHLEKGSACAGGGRLVPPLDSQVTLRRLQVLVDHYRPTSLIAVGDSFHDIGAAARLNAADVGALQTIAAHTRIVWVCGNHDPCPPAGIGGDSFAEFAVDAVVFRHQARPGAGGEVSGHFHPKARIATRAGDIVRPCFMADPDRIMLPAFGAYTGGLDICSPAIAALYPRGGEAFLLGQQKLFRFAVSPPGLRVAPRLAAEPPAHRFP